MMKKEEKNQKKGNKTDRPRVDAVGIVKYTVVVVLVLVGLYLMLMPVLPMVTYYVGDLFEETEFGPFSSGSGIGTSGDGEMLEEGEIPDENTLMIRAVDINVVIVEGQTDSALSMGAWHRPGTGNPVDGGNMVVTGHRFRYLPPSNLTFYHLDKVREGDDIVVYWEGKRYDYTVTEIFVVEPEQVEVESATALPRLTLYTCTPLWTAKQRLVVVAEPKEGGEMDGSEKNEVELEELQTEE